MQIKCVFCDVRFASAGDDGQVLIWNIEVSRTELLEYANHLLMIW